MKNIPFFVMTSLLMSATSSYAEIDPEKREEIYGMMVDVAWEAIDSGSKDIIKVLEKSSLDAEKISKSYISIVEANETSIKNVLSGKGAGFTSGEEFKAASYKWMDISRDLKKSADDLKQAAINNEARAKDLSKKVKWVGNNVAIWANVYENYQLLKESTDLANKFPGFNLEADPPEYYGISGKNTVIFVVGKVFPKIFGGGAGIGISLALEPVQTGWSVYDTMPTDKARLRDWVKFMAKESSDVRYYSTSLKSGSATGIDIPGGLIQYLQVADKINPDPEMAWVHNWTITNKGEKSWQTSADQNPISQDACKSPNYSCNPVLGNIISGLGQGANSHFGSSNLYAGWGLSASEVDAKSVIASNSPIDNSRSQQITGLEQAALAKNAVEFKSSDWVMVSGDANKHFSNSDAFGSIVAPSAGPITALNNADVQESVMQRVVTIPTGVKSVTVGMMANFVTNEYPKFVGSEFNDNAVIEIKTGSGNVYQATLFNKELNSANFKAVDGLPKPMDASGGQTGFENLNKTIPVANGGQLTITVKTRNVGDTDVPSATLIHKISVK